MSSTGGSRKAERPFVHPSTEAFLQRIVRDENVRSLIKIKLGAASFAKFAFV